MGADARGARAGTPAAVRVRFLAESPLIFTEVHWIP